jgi:cytochrome P450
MAFLSGASLWLGAVSLIVTSVGLLVYTAIHDMILWRRLPPGPKPVLFLGNKFQLPDSKPWIQFQQWSKQYGPIFTIWIGRRPTIVLSDPYIAQELLEKRSQKYSSRPRMVVMGEIYWDGASILVQPYGKKWSIRRKLLRQALTPKALSTYKPIQEAEAARLCFQIAQYPENWEKLFERFTSSVVFSVAYGHRIDSLDAAVIRQRFDSMQYIASLNVPGRYLVETFPFLKYLPNIIAPWKREIETRGKADAVGNMALVDVVRSDIATARSTGKLDELPHSLCRMMLEAREGTYIPLSDRDFSFLPASLFGAGSDTTASSMCSAILALVTHPEVLRAAHIELDTVIGSNRTPTSGDEADLPYICALVKEVLRWRPVAVMGGTPHASTEDDYYYGWFIPRGTTILGNTWAINLSEEYYPNPHLFDPARFLDGNGCPEALKGKLHPAKNGHSSFGWGRRICPGADLAVNSLFISLAKILWAFNILPAKGMQYDTFAYTVGINSRPKKFECVIRVRSQQHLTVLQKEMKEAEICLERLTPFA